VLSRIALFTVAFAAALGLADHAIRVLRIDDRLMAGALVFQGIDAPVHRESPDWFLHYDLAPGTSCECSYDQLPPYQVHIDEFGARFPTHAAHKSPGSFRILFFGGSTMYGAAVSDDETIPAAVERLLNRAASGDRGERPRQFEAWNFGSHAYVLSQAAQRARRELLLRDPDLIVVQLHNKGPRAFFRPPFADPIDYLQRYAADPHLIPENFPPPLLIPSSAHFSLMRHSGLYRALAGTHRRWQRSDIAYAQELSRDQARALVREADVHEVPVVFLGLPGAPPNVTPEIYPELPLERYIHIYEPGREGPFYDLHPPAKYLEEYAVILVRELQARGLIAAAPGPPDAAAGNLPGNH